MFINFLTNLYEAGTADQLFRVYNIDQGFLYCYLFYTGHIKSIHVLPPWQTSDVPMDYMRAVSIITSTLTGENRRKKKYLQWIL